MTAPAPAPSAAPARWLATRAGRTMAGRFVAAIGFGLVLATSMAHDQREDRQRGRTLTREQYEKSFDAHRDSLLHVDDTTPPLLMGVAVVAVVVFFLAFFEGAAWVVGLGVGIVDDAAQRRAQRRRARILDDTDE